MGSLACTARGGSGGAADAAEADAEVGADATPDAAPDAASPPDAPPDVPVEAAAPRCRSDRECTAMGQVCDFTSGACVDCVRDADCGTMMVCLASRCVTPVRCTTTRMCPGQVCDTVRGFCVDCLTNVDCPPGLTCRGAGCFGL